MQSNPNFMAGFLEVDKYVLDYRQSVPLPMNKEVWDSVTLVGKTMQPVRYRLLTTDGGGEAKFSVRFEPQMGVLQVKLCFF
jgi:hypothetical protein